MTVIWTGRTKIVPGEVVDERARAALSFCTIGMAADMVRGRAVSAAKLSEVEQCTQLKS